MRWAGYSWGGAVAKNCWPSGDGETGAGATDHECCPRSTSTVKTKEDCKDHCVATPGCDGITHVAAFAFNPMKCYLRHQMNLDNCDDIESGITSSKLGRDSGAFFYFTPPQNTFVLTLTVHV